jgi:tetratricopeptide (TPR) repeat protein
MKARSWIAVFGGTTIGAVGLLAVWGRDAYWADRRRPTETPLVPARFFEPAGPIRPLTTADLSATPVDFTESSTAAAPHRPAFDWQSAGPQLPPETRLPAAAPPPAALRTQPRMLVESTDTPPVVRLPAVPAERPKLRPPVRLPPITPEVDRPEDGGLPSNPTPMPTMRPGEPRDEDVSPRTARLRGTRSSRLVSPLARPQQPAPPKSTNSHATAGHPDPARPFGPAANAAEGPTLAAPQPAETGAADPGGKDTPPAGGPVAHGAASSRPSDDAAPRRPAETAPLRSGVAVAVARLADEQIRRGFDLAQRSAFFSAREAFVRALRIVAEAHDAEREQAVHSAALAAGLRALEESDQFVPDGAGLEAEINVAAIISAHRTPVYHNKPTEGVTPLKVRREYYTYAQEQLTLAVEGEPIGSMALYALGKLHSESAQKRLQAVPAAESKALVFQQAAVSVRSDNFMAANELGVLLARAGRHEEARDWILHSVKLSPEPTAWHNLSVVHQSLGETKLAQLAEQEARRVSAQRGLAASPGGKAPDVQWIKPQEFAAQMRVEPAASESVRPANTASGAPPTATRGDGATASQRK